MAITEVRSNYTGTEKAAEPTTKKQESADRTCRSTTEYADYLNGKYSCLQGARDRTVTIAPDLLSKAASDSKTSQWLEENLKLIPDVMDKIYQNTAQNGGRVVSCNISFDGYDSMTTQVHAIYGEESGADEKKKMLEEIREKNKEQKKQQEDLLEKREHLRTQRIVSNDAESLLGKVTRLDFAQRNHMGGVSIDFKI